MPLVLVLVRLIKSGAATAMILSTLPRSMPVDWATLWLAAWALAPPLSRGSRLSSTPRTSSLEAPLFWLISSRISFSGISSSGK